MLLGFGIGWAGNNVGLGGFGFWYCCGIGGIGGSAGGVKPGNSCYIFGGIGQ